MLKQVILSNFQIKNKFSLKRLLLFLFILNSLGVLSQELPPIQNFIPENYNAGNQNWMISQDVHKNIYIANNDGLLTFNGSKWTLYPSPNKTIIRSVKVVGDIVYTGSFTEFGYWVADSFGTLKYTSLVSKSPKKILQEEYFWKIVNYEKWIIFQSSSNMYIYDISTEKINVYSLEGELNRVFNVDNQLYYQLKDKNIYALNQGISEPIISNDRTKAKIINIFKQDGVLLFITESNNIKVLKNKRLELWDKSDEILDRVTIYSAIKLKDESFVYGTISDGIFHFNSEGKLLHHINRSNGLGNNTVLSLFEDVDQNLWVGLDNGIDVINFKSPISIYNDKNGELGTVYSSIVHNDYLYLGTNQGLFYKIKNSKDSFKIIYNTEGQVWCLKKYNNQLFCGHNSGVFLIDKHSASLISSIKGVWDLKKISHSENQLLLGTYNGLAVIHKIDDKWSLKNRVKGFDVSSRSIEFTDDKTLWVNHEYKGLYKLKLDAEFKNVIDILLDSTFSKTNNSSIAKFNNELYYASKKGTYKYDKKGQLFKKDTLLSNIISYDNYVSGKLINDRLNRLWSFSRNYISFVSLNQLTNTLKNNSISIPSSLRKGMIGFENITRIDEGTYLLGTSNGYLKIKSDIAKSNKKTKITINDIFTKTIGQPLFKLEHNEHNKLKYSNNSIGFNYSVSNYDKFSSLQYQYKLNGLYDKWSDWSTDSTVFFNNLNSNKYTFNVRANLDGNLTNIEEFKFEIKSPWYLSTLALITYLIFTFIIIFIINKVLKWYYNRESKHKELKNNQLIMKINNDKLNQEINSKNRELAISTMSLVRKNKVLGSIKKELMIIDKDKYSVAISLIDKSLNNKKDWKYFERAFNNADKDFLAKLKGKHSNLTPNDLRFCAFLRLNLSSKELAPLLNISYRSVEIKRYRLRKKMNLPHKESLIEHILSI